MTTATRDRVALNNVLSIIPDKTAYVEATQRCPDLIERESNPDLFLQFEDLPEAALRLVNYWETRKRLFGEKAFLSIFDLQHGALSANAKELLQFGVGVWLPPDDFGRSVAFVDRSRANPIQEKLSLQDRQQGCFYLLNQRMLVSKEFVLVMLFRSSPRPKFIPSMSSGFMDMVERVFPVSLKAMHVVCLADQSAVKNFMKLFFPIILRILNRFVNKVFQTLEIGGPQDLKLKLAVQGIPEQNLPESVGGTWSYSQFDEWLYQQRQGSRCSLELLAEAATGISAKASASSVAGEALAGLENALEKLVIFEKQNYLDALKTAPEIVKEEADPKLFLREDEAPDDTARRVTNYWNLRSDLFESRAVLPMKLTGEGALDRRDLQVLECGYCTILPKNKHGHTVICLDPSRSSQPSHVESLRCLFYMLTVARKEASKGVVILFVMNKLSFQRLQKQFVLPKILQAIPIEIVCLHVIRQPARLGERVFADKVVPSMQLLLGTVAPIQVHSGTASSKLKAQLEDQGFFKEDLPRSLGGGWNYQHFLAWRDAQIRAESSSLISSPASHTTAHAFHPSPSPTVAGFAAAPRFQPDSLSIRVPRPLAVGATLPVSCPRPTIKTDAVLLHQALQNQQRVAEIQALLQLHHNSRNGQPPLDQQVAADAGLEQFFLQNR